jgi:ATP/maltotriose-dependent transcriptional regulator MalT
MTMDVHPSGRALFVGRQDELRLLRARLDEVRAGEPRAVLVQGAPGIGKTALLQRFLAESTDLRVVTASGEEEEHLLPYAVVEQLVRSSRVPRTDQRAALGATTIPPRRAGAIGAGLVELLDSLQEHGPVCVVVDDAQWADRPSMVALLFAMRRLHADRVLTLIAVHEDRAFDLPAGLLKLADSDRGSTLRLRGLPLADLRELAAALTEDVVPVSLAEQLREHTGANPLHLRALLEEFPLERLRRASDAPLPTPRSVGAQVVARVSACPPPAQQLVVATAILGMQCPLILAQRLAGIDDPLGALEAAMSAGLLETHDAERDHGIAFPDAMTRSAIYNDIGPARRAALHLRAAELVNQPDAALQHRSAAALGEDEPLASDLAAHARRQAARGALARAATAMLRSSDLSPASAQRERRLLEGVDCLLVSGDVNRAATLTDEVSRCADGPYRRYVLGRLAFRAGRPAEARELLLGAWDLCDRSRERELAGRIAAELALVHIRQAHGAEAVPWARRAVAASEGTTTPAPWAHLAYALVYAGDAPRGLAELAFLPEMTGELTAELTAEHVQAAYARGLLRVATDDLAGARTDLAAVEPAARRWGPFAFVFAGLSLLAEAEYRLGCWDDAVDHAEAAASIGEDAGQVWMLSWLHATAAAPLAGRGEWDRARAHTEAAARHARAVQDDGSVADAAIAAARLAAARDDHEAVVDALAPMLRMPRREGVDEPGAQWPWQELYADALVRLDRLDEADSVLLAFEELAALRDAHGAMANAARVRGNLEAARKRPDLADAAFRAGLEHSRPLAVAFDRARLEAAYGRFLRRTGKRGAGLTVLRAARDRFDRLGARPYVECCDRELIGAGANSRHRQRPTLTRHEVAVVRLVTQGLTNHGVAEQLVVSLNTVEYHLKNIYRKLGVASRTQLVAQLAREELDVDEGGGGTPPG